MTSGSISLRAQRTHRALLDAGLELLAERPIDALAIDEIVAKAGVAKGSFFNHFADKPAFGRAIGTAIRLEIEQRIGLANADLADPFARLAGGMRTGLAFALEEPRKAAIALRSLDQSTLRDHPLNQGIVADMTEALATGQLRSEAASSGVRFWLGLCMALMINALERRPDRGDAANRLAEMTVLGLTGLGLPEERAQAYASVSEGLLRLGR